MEFFASYFFQTNGSGVGIITLKGRTSNCKSSLLVNCFYSSASLFKARVRLRRIRFINSFGGIISFVRSKYYSNREILSFSKLLLIPIFRVYPNSPYNRCENIPTRRKQNLNDITSVIFNTIFQFATCVTNKTGHSLQVWLMTLQVWLMMPLTSKAQGPLILLSF